MRRGEVWTVAAGTGYAGKPRPVVILQNVWAYFTTQARGSSLDDGLPFPHFQRTPRNIRKQALTRLGVTTA